MNFIAMFLLRRFEKRMFKKLLVKALESKVLKGKLTLASILPLLIGSVAGALGLDIAPTSVDLAVTFVSSALATFGYARAVYQAFKKDVAAQPAVAP